MGSIPGPILRFRFDQTSAQQAGRQLTKSLQSQMQQVSKTTAQMFSQSLGNAGRKSAEQFASAWQTAAAKLRASLTSEKLGLSQIAKERERIISLAQTEANILQKKDALSVRELSRLKAATLEIERQKSALSGTGGLTGGTRSVIQQLLSGISARAGSYGGGFGSFGGLRVSEPLGKFAEEATGIHLVALGVGTAAVAITAALADLAKRGAEFAVQMRNAAETSGISVKSAVELRSVSASLGLDFDTVSTSFRKFNQQLTLAMGASLPHASIEAKRAGEIFQILGVNVKQAAADPAEGLAQLSKALLQLPDGAVKSAVELQLLGRGGREAAPLLNHFADALAATKKTSDALAGKIGDAATAGDALATTTANLSNQWHLLEVNLATVFVPLLTGIVGLTNKLFPDVNNLLPPLGQRVPRDINGNPINIPAPISSAASVALAAGQKFSINLGANPGALQSPDKMKALIGALAINPPTGSGGRGADFSQPLYLKQAVEEWDKYEKAVVKAYDAHQKLLEQMKKTNSALFLQNSILTDLNGAIGMAIGSPDKTGAGLQKFFDKINEANEKTAKKAAEEWQRQFDKLKESVGNLFDAMLQGARSFGQALTRMVETALLAPIKEAFSTKIAQMIQSIEKSIQKHSTGKNSKGAGGFFAKILAALGLGGTVAQQQNIAQSNVNAMTVGTLTVLGGSTNIPKPTGSSFADFFGGGGGTTSFSSLSGLGGLSMAFATAGGMAVAGSGGSNVAAPGGTVNAGGVAGAATKAGGILSGISNNRAVQAIAPLIPGLALLGTGLATHNGPATALGIGMAAGAGLTELSKLQSLQGMKIGNTNLGNVLGAFGKAAPGIGMMFAGNQTGGLGGAAMGALGGLQAGAAIGSLFGPMGTAVGAAIGAITGGIMGIFGKKDNTKAWERGVTRAMNNQRITQPLSENFAFAATNSMASTFATTFSQGPGGFSNSTLPANTPFWANAILGTPRGTRNQILWNQMMNGINPNSPFFGGTANPFTGGPLPNGLRLPGAPTGVFSPNSGYGYGGGGSNVSVHFTVPGYVDKAGLADIVKTAAPLIHRVANDAVYKQSSGARRAISRAVNLP